MGPIYQLSQVEEEKIFVEYLEKMIQEKKIRPSSSSVGSPILFVPKPWGKAFISKKHFRPGGMAPSEWTRSVRAVRVTPVADYSAPGADTTRRVACHPPIAVSPFLLALSVSNCK